MMNRKLRGIIIVKGLNQREDETRTWWGATTMRGSNQGETMNKNMRSSNCKKFEPRKENEQKHHGELWNINNGGIKTIGRP